MGVVVCSVKGLLLLQVSFCDGMEDLVRIFTTKEVACRSVEKF